jgi:hypothetical protein
MIDIFGRGGEESFTYIYKVYFDSNSPRIYVYKDREGGEKGLFELEGGKTPHHSRYECTAGELEFKCEMTSTVTSTVNTRTLVINRSNGDFIQKISYLGGGLAFNIESLGKCKEIDAIETLF